MKNILIPQNNSIIVKEIESKYQGGLVRAKNEFDKSCIGKIIAIAENIEGYKPGEIIIYSEFEGEDVPKIKGINEEDLLMIDVGDIKIKVETKDLTPAKQKELGFKR